MCLCVGGKKTAGLDDVKNVTDMGFDGIQRGGSYKSPL